jgi:glycosyltransferase involved in cell wall biosynthesis
MGDPVRVIRLEKNLGYGGAIKAGIRSARYSWILITDADGTYRAEDIPKLLNQPGEWDMVVGARTSPEARHSNLRQFAKWFLLRLAEHLSETRIDDLNSGLRLFRRDVALRHLTLLPSGFSLTTTLTLALLSEGYKVCFVPVGYNRRVGKSKIRPVQDTLNFLMLILRTSVYFNPLRVFLPLGAILLLSGLALLIYGLTFSSRIYDVTITILALSALQIVAIGLLADLFVKKSGRQ